MEQEQTPKQVQSDDTETIPIEERDAKREFNNFKVQRQEFTVVADTGVHRAQLHLSIKYGRSTKKHEYSDR